MAGGVVHFHLALQDDLKGAELSLLKVVLDGLVCTEIFDVHSVDVGQSELPHLFGRHANNLITRIRAEHLRVNDFGHVTKLHREVEGEIGLGEELVAPLAHPLVLLFRALLLAVRTGRVPNDALALDIEQFD